MGEIVDTFFGQEVYWYDDFMYRQFKSGMIWDENVCQEICKHLVEGTDILDVGAYNGCTTLSVLKLLKDMNKKVGRIHCFESDQTTFRLLEKNMGGHKNVIMYPFAVGDQPQICHTKENIHNKGCNHVYETIKGEIKENYEYEFYPSTDVKRENVVTAMLPLDICYFENRISVIKIDVEGFECEVLKGAKNIIERDRPVLIMEIFNDNMKRVANVIGEYGYDRFIYMTEQNYVFFHKTYL